ncbi:MAG TPA: chorismate-binding protein, partial [Chlamydiales bacterium]
MKIFWRNKEGEKAPLNACFQLLSFTGEKEALFSSVVQKLPSPFKPQLKSRSDFPNRLQWKMAVEDALKQIEQGSLEKVVLARETTLVFDQEIDPFRFTSALQTKTRGGALFCAELDNGQAFAGVSPERLFRRQGDQVITEAVAGTRRLGLDQELLQSTKDLREFRYVEDYLKQELGALCHHPLSFSEITLHQTAHVQHLFSEARGLLRSPADPSILKAL